MPAARNKGEPELPELEKMTRLMAFNTTESSRQKIVLAARLAKKRTATFLREIVDAEVERRLSGAATNGGGSDQRLGATG